MNPGINHQILTDDQYHATCIYPDLNPNLTGDKRVCYPLCLTFLCLRNMVKLAIFNFQSRVKQR